jgi:geranylgeranyl diphosphate synthase type II
MAPSESQRSDEENIPSNGMVDLVPRIELALKSACRWQTDCPERLAEAMRYSLLAPGKRLRPAMVLMACEAVGGGIDRGLVGAVAVEMVHAYSLVHDDLPAMDDDDLRRGRPTTHIQFDEATAILAGDALLAASFEQLTSDALPPQIAIECLRTLAHAAGPECLVGGQAEDLAAEKGGEQTLLRLEAIHRRKTGALFDASIRIGGLIGGGNKDAIAALHRYSRPLGLAFQVVDDCLDHTATAESLGKRTGKDQARGKLTYPGLLGLDAAKDLAATLVAESLSAVDVFGNAAWRLRWLARFVLDRTR